MYEKIYEKLILLFPCSFLDSFLDFYYTDIGTLETPSQHLSKVIGLIKTGEFDNARSETLRLIYASIKQENITIDSEAVTNEQATRIAPILDSIFSTIESSGAKYFLYFVNIF